MKTTVEKILKGQFDYEKGSLELSTSRIELALFPGQIVAGSFFVNGVPGRITEGHVYSNDIRMKLITDSFSGETSEIGYSFSALGLEEGDVVSGEIIIISNQGEYYLPYVSTIQQKNIDSSLGNIKNLFHFTNLAKSNWDEAVKLFYSDEFLSVFKGNDAQYKKVYLGLSHFYGNEQNVEEFLMSINKKQAVEYIPERDTIVIHDPSTITEEYVNITRNGWGYTSLHVETEGSFVSVSKSEITDNDFLGNFLSFPVTINPENLHGGQNLGRVRFFNAFTNFEVTVLVSSEVISKHDLSKHLEYNHAQYDLLTYYEAFRTKKINSDTWITESSHIVDRMQQIFEEELLPKLLKAQLLIMEERYNEAKWILDKAETELNEKGDFLSATWAYYLYLTTMISREESYIDMITAEVSKIYSNDQSDWRVGWMLLYLSEDYAVSPQKKWLFIEQQIETGCISPVFYVEAANMLIGNPGLLCRLSHFEIKIIGYMVKKEMLTEDCARQFVYLVSKEKKFSKHLLDLCEEIYKLFPNNDTATVICEYLIKGDIKDSKAHEWYLFAITNELRVTMVYEYFMQSMDLSMDYEIPKMVYLYFSYESNLSWEYAAFLFSHILKDKDEYPDIFESFKPQIERFAAIAILDRHINKDMASIYRYVLNDVTFTDEMSKALSSLLFTHKITVNNKEFTKVIVYQSHECVEQTYPLVNGVAYVPLYNKDFVILFEDGLSNRYAEDSEYELEMLMVPGKLAARLLPVIKDNLEFNVYALESSSEMVEISEETKERYAMVLEDTRIEEDYKALIREKIISFYYEKDMIRELDAILEDYDPLIISKRERILAIKYMVMRGMYEKAIDWIIRFGPEGVDIRDLVKLASKLIERNEFIYNDDYVRICASVFFKGKYDETILKYLVDNYRGMTKDMRKIFNAAENFDLDLYKMCENLILQMLTTGYFVSERMDIYKRYVQGGANSDIQNAYLSQCSFDYFVKEALMEPYVFEELTKVKVRGEKIQKVEMLAYLKFYSENTSLLDETIKGICDEYLKLLVSEGIYMSFFKVFFEGSDIDAGKFSDKTIIEYKTDPGKKVFIHYVIEGDEETLSEYVTEEMPDMYGGVHAKAFILFFGENLLYYITEESEGEELLTESASIQKSDINRENTDSRFNEVNDIVIAKTLQDYDTVNSLLYDHHKHNYIVKKMFKLL